MFLWDCVVCHILGYSPELGWADVIVLSALNINGFLSQNQHKGYEGHGKYLSTTWYLLFSEEKSIILPKYPLKCAVLEKQWCRQQHLRILLFEDNSSRFLQFFVPCTDNPSSKESSLQDVFVTRDFSDRRYCGLASPLVLDGLDWVMIWCNYSWHEVMLTQRINTLWHDWHQWRAAPSGLKEIFSLVIPSCQDRLILS